MSIIQVKEVKYDNCWAKKNINILSLCILVTISDGALEEFMNSMSHPTILGFQRQVRVQSSQFYIYLYISDDIL